MIEINSIKRRINTVKNDYISFNLQIAEILNKNPLLDEEKVERYIGISYRIALIHKAQILWNKLTYQNSSQFYRENNFLDYLWVLKSLKKDIQDLLSEKKTDIKAIKIRVKSPFSIYKKKKEK